VAPIGFWMHRGCVPFVSPEQFDTIYWPTLKPIIEELWANGKQTLFYAEGDWNAHLAAFTELPDQSIVYHVDKADIFEAHRALGKKFCISGGVPNYLLAYGAPEDVEARCKEVIDGVASEGGYIMDASAIIQNDAKAENIRAMTEFTRAYGAYSSQGPDEPPPAPEPPPIGEAGFRGLADLPEPTAKPGVCVPWTEERSRLPEDVSNEPLVKRVWENVDALAYTYVWQCLLSF
jgi:hypothetical protein